VKQPILLGHSTGGMLATRYALMYPQQTKLLAMVNPIGLEDWKAKGVPYRTIDQWYQRELKVSAESIKAYELKTDYQGVWKPEYDKWVDMLAGLN
ncbi:alpha/beta fold hydrolase, partial [Acinetobacter baumannii]|uniref:alpha/beta fold hydrolase n=1 Tax=Acinetobacter baumannii TaxID=470 RepID=UPI000A535864